MTALITLYNGSNYMQLLTYIAYLDEEMLSFKKKG